MNFNAPKKGYLPTFFWGQTPHFISEKQKNRSNNLHHRKAGSVAVILTLRMGVHYVQKWCNNIPIALCVLRPNKIIIDIAIRVTTLLYHHIAKYFILGMS